MGMDTEAMLMQALSPDSKIAQEIGLTEAQSQELKKLVPGAQKDMQEYREKMEKLAEEQANLLSQDTPDEVAVMKVVEQLGQMRTEIAKKRIQQVLAAQKILTPEQRAQLREKLKARMEQFREGRGMREGGFRPRREGQPPPGAPPPVAPPQPPPAVPAPPAPAK
jgi:Spy/CpxP family protein refolding chaperone